jgi:hypothetical protein
VSPNPFFAENFKRGKVAPKIEIKKLPKVNKRPIGKNSPNPVTQAALAFRTLLPFMCQGCQIFLGTRYQNGQN